MSPQHVQEQFPEGQVVHHKLSGEKLVVTGHKPAAESDGSPKVVCCWKGHDEWKEQAFEPTELLAGERSPEL